MKATKVLKILTVVVFLVTGSGAWGQDGKTREQCEADCELGDHIRSGTCKDPNEKGLESKEKVDRNTCVESEINSCKRKARCASLEVGETKKDIKTACTAAVKEWDEAVGKELGACSDYQATNSEEYTRSGKKEDNSCENRVKACEKKIGEVSRLLTSSSSSTPGEISPTGGTMDVLLQFYAQRNKIDPKQFQRDGNLIVTTSCLKWSNDRTDDKKKELESKLDRIDEKIKAAKKSITDLEKDVAKDNAELRKETSTIDEDKEKIKTASGKELTEIEKKRREKETAYYKKIQDRSVQIRKLTTELTKRKEDLETLKFEYAQRMVVFADNKIEKQCRSAVDTARRCFVDVAKGVKFPPKDPCEGFSSTGKGVTGTSIMNSRLNDVRNACFEQANQTIDKERFGHTKAVRLIEQDIIEKSNQVKDLNRTADLDKQEFEAMVREYEKEKSDETNAMELKIANLVEKLNKLTISTQDKLTTSDREMKRLQLEIDELVARKLPSALGIIPDANGNDIKVAHQEAKKAILALESKRSTAYTECGCEAKLKANKEDTTCTKFKKKFSDKDDGGVGGIKTRRAR